MQGEKISVIIPVFNSEKYLKRTIESVIEQTYKNLQIVLVDDGSTDRSLSICEGYSKTDNRIQVIHQENQGVSAARNRGLEIAEGTYVLFMDSDDYLENNACELLCTSISPNDYMCVCGNYIEMDPQSGNRLLKFPPCPISGVFSTDNIIEKLLTGKEVKSHLWNKLIRKSEIGEIRFNTEIKYQENFDFILRVCKNAKGTVKLIDSYLYHYIARDDGLTHNQQNRLKSLEIIANGILRNLPESRSLICRYSLLYLNECTSLAIMRKNDKSIVSRNCRYIRRNINKIWFLLNKRQLIKILMLCINFDIFAFAVHSIFILRMRS